MSPSWDTWDTFPGSTHAHAGSVHTEDLSHVSQSRQDNAPRSTTTQPASPHPDADRDPMTAAAHGPAVPSAPLAGELRSAVCACCCELIPAGRLHFLLEDCRIVCGSCVSRPAQLGQRVAAPLLDHVVAYGSRSAVAAMLNQRQAAHTQHTQPVSPLVSGFSPDQQTGASAGHRG